MTGDIRNRVQLPRRVRLADGTEVTGAVIDYCLRQQIGTQARHRMLERYYNNQTAIQSRRAEDPDKPNNRISHSFAKYITKVATAYFMGYGIRYDIKDDGYRAALDEVLDSNMAKIRHFEEAKEMSKHGVSYELLYIDPDGRLRFQQFGADEIIPVYSESLGNFLVMALRPYETSDIVRSRKTKYVEVYTRQYVETWRRAGGGWKLEERFSHNFSDVPVIVRFNNAELRGDYEDVIPQIDAYDKAQSDTANDLDYFTDAYLVLEGIDDLNAVDENGDDVPLAESAKIMKKNRVIYTPPNSKAECITKDSNDTTSETFKKRCYKDIFFISQVPNLTDEEFAGNLSGVAIKYKLFGLEELSIEKETYFTSSETKKLRLITEYLNTLKGAGYDYKEVTLTFDRSAVANTYEIAQIISLLQDTLSEETLISMVPEVEDVAVELKRKQKEREEKENLFLPPDDDEDGT